MRDRSHFVRWIVMGVGLTLGVLLSAFAASSAQAAGNTFVSTWQPANTSTGSSPSNQVTLPLTSDGNYNFTVDWGDGSTSTITAYNQAEVTHTYASGGAKTISITGTIKGWRFANTGDRLKLTDISAWGPLQLGNSGGYFWGASNLQISASDEPDLSSTSNMSSAFFGASALTGATLNDWNVSGVTDMSRMFYGASAFTGDISGWNTGAATTMTSMFRGATSFNADISGWNTAAVTNLSSMFRSATAFNRNLGSWQIGNVTSAANMFLDAGVSRTNYDSLLVGWAAQTVKPSVVFDAGSSKYTVGAASTARATLVTGNQWEITDGGWTTVPGVPPTVQGTKAPESATITWGASTANNSPVLDYTVTVTAPDGVATPQPCVTSASNRSCVFTGLVNGATYQFTVKARNEVGYSAESAPISVTPQIDPPGTPAKPLAVALDGKAYVTFSEATGGGTPETYTVTSTPGNKTCTTNVTDQDPYVCTVNGLTNGTNYTFTVKSGNVGGTSADSPASNSVTPGPVFATTWDTTKTRPLTEGGTGPNRIMLPLKTDGTYDFVVAWGDGKVSRIITSDVTSNGVGIQHVYDTPGIKNVTITGTIKGFNLNQGVPKTGERDKLVDVTSWGPLKLQTTPGESRYFADAANLQVTATDQLDLTGTTSLKDAFAGSPNFNGAIANWNVSGVTDMSGMFNGATSFNRDLSGWNVANVTDMSKMFAGATSFNSSVAWTAMPKVATTSAMFDGATSFNQALGWPASLAALTDTSKMFAGATAFNADVSGFDMNGVTNASSMFAGATSFNGSVGDWNTSTITKMTDMFEGASAFDQDLYAWNFEAVTSFGKFLAGTSTGIYNYNRFLATLANQNVQPDAGQGANTTIDSRAVSPAKREYSVGKPTADRAEIVGRGFTVLDDGQTNKDVPDAPTSIGVTGDGNDATVTWVAPFDHNSPITKYTVVAILRTDATQTVTCENTTTSCSFTSLPETWDKYLYQVTATNAIGTSDPSDITAPEKPAAPSVVAGDGKVTVIVSPAATGAKASTYNVRVVGDSAKFCTVQAPDTSCDVTGLTNGQTYRFESNAMNWVGSSAYSDPSPVTSPGLPFSTTWRTGNTSTGSSNANQIRLPLTAAQGSDYDFYVSWGDGSTDHITSSSDPAVTHTYAKAGSKDVTITGTIKGWRFNNAGDRLKLTNVSSWGSLQLGNQDSFFYGASNMTVTATDVLDLTGTGDLSNAFLEAAAFNGDVTGWNTSGVTNLTNTFKGTTAFTGTGLSTWNVENVNDMFGTFQDSAVNADISGWKVGNVTDMKLTFAGNTKFNQNISTWDVSKVEDMSEMFHGATAFNADISGWDTRSSRNMQRMFAGATSFNRDLSGWAVYSVTDMSGMFNGATAFSGDFSSWEVWGVRDFTNFYRKTGGPTGDAAVAWYNKLLTSWAAQDLQGNFSGNGITLTMCGVADTSGNGCGPGAPQYSPGAATRARQTLINRGWTIIDGGQSTLKAPDRIAPVTVKDPVGGGTNVAIEWPAPNDNGSPILSYALIIKNKTTGDVLPSPFGDDTHQAICSQFPPPYFYDGNEYVLEPIMGTECNVPGSPDDYYYSATATNAIGTSLPSLYAAPDKPAKPLVVPGNGSARVIVSPVDGASKYVVETVGIPEKTCEIIGDDTSCLVSGLNNGTQYTFHVKSQNDLGDSAWSTQSDPQIPSEALFTSTWDTTLTSNGSLNARRIALPLTDSGEYDFHVNWGDGEIQHVTSAADAMHEYQTGGTKYLSISGTIKGWRFANTGDRLKLSDVTNWGSLRLGNAGDYFAGASNMTVSATDKLNITGTSDLSGMFAGASSFNQNISNWDTSLVTDMSSMFAGATAFNQDLSNWDTGSVTDMTRMFYDSSAYGFRTDVSKWDISNVTSFSEMFVKVPSMTGPKFISWYNRLLTSWAAQPVQEGAVPLAVCGAEDLVNGACPNGVKYYGTAASAARLVLADKGWVISDGGSAAANIPDVPTGVQLTRNGPDLTVSWTAPSDNGSPITNYIAVADPSGAFCETASTSCVIEGLSTNEAYKYSVTVVATNGVGDSEASAPFPELRPGAPGKPTAALGNGQATVTVPASTTGGDPNRYVVTSTPDGKTCEITNLNGPLSCAVTGLTNGNAYTFTAAADNDGGTSENSAASDPVTPIAPARTPALDAPTRTDDGFTVQISNYDATFTWTVVEASPGNLTTSIDGNGLITVSALAPGASGSFKVKATQFGYLDGTSGTVSSNALEAAFVPVLGTVTPIAGGFTVPITNYKQADPAVNWLASVSPDTGEAAIDDAGLVTVTKIASGTEAELTVTAKRTDHADGSATAKATALYPAVVPTFGSVTRTVDGFTVPITNVDDDPNVQFSVASLQAPGDVQLSSGTLTVTGLTPGEKVTLTVTTQANGYASGQATVKGAALEAAVNPKFGTPNVNTTGFTVAITNFSENDEFEWTIASVVPSPGEASIDPKTGVITVTKIPPGVEATVTVGNTREGYVDGQAQVKATTAIASAHVPEFAEPTRTKDGYTVEIENYDPAFTWEVESVVPNTAQAVLSETGMITVTKLGPGESATVTVSAKQFGYVDGQNSVQGSALEAALAPTFDTPTATADGFTVLITNYLANKTDYIWEAEDPPGVVTASLNKTTGLLTVAGVAPGTAATATVTTTRDGYVKGSADATGTSLTGAQLTPVFGTVTRTPDGFTVPIVNYLANKDDYTWTAEDPAGAATASLDIATGVVTVANVEPGKEATVTVTSKRTGYADGSADQKGQALQEALTPNFGTVTRTVDGFTVPISNYLANKDDYTWDVVDPAGTPEANLNKTTGVVTVTKVAPGTEETVTVTTKRPEYADGQASQPGNALEAALVPTFGTVMRTADGFTVQIDNYLANKDTYTWAVDDPADAPTATLDAATGLVTVAKVAPGAEATVTVTTKRTDYADGSAAQKGQALQAALIPTFGSITRTVDGFTVPISNFLANKDTYTWDVVDPQGAPEASLNKTTGVVTVTKVAPGTEETVTVTTKRPEYADGQADKTGKALEEALIPSFATPTPTKDGFTAQIDNYVTNKDDYTWTVDSVLPSPGEASINPTTGLVTVTKIAPGTSATVKIRTSRTDYAPGSGEVTEKSINGAALDPTFGTTTRTPDGFTVQIDNYLANKDAYTWSVNDPDGAPTATLNKSTGLVTVANVAAGQEATVTVQTTRTGYDTGSADKTARAMYAANTPTFDTVTRTPVGFTVKVSNFDKDDAFTWAIGSVSPGTAVAQLDQVTGLITVTALAPGAEGTVVVTSKQSGYVDGQATIKGSALNAALTPAYGNVTRGENQFSVPVTNFGPSDPYTWTATVTPGSAAVNFNQSTGVATVTGLDDGAEAEITVVASRDGYVDGSAKKKGNALNAARVPAFDTPTRTADGFEVQLTNHDAQFTWQGSATASGQVAISGSGLVRVTGVAPETDSTVTVTTSRSGYRNGTSTAEARSLKAAWVPVLGDAQVKADGFIVPISNYNDNFQWTVTATNTDDEVTLSDGGVIEVTGLDPGETSAVQVVARRVEHADGVLRKVLSARTGEALTPILSAPTSAAGGFTVQITNFKSGFTWSAVTGSGRAAIDPAGLVTVTGLAPQATATVTVTAARSGFNSGTASATGSALPATADIPAPAAPPTAPRITKVEHPSAKSLKLTWETSSDGGAPITRATATCRSVADGKIETKSDNGDSVTLKGLDKDTKYRCTINVTNRVATSTDSAVTTTRTKKPKKLKQPNKQKKQNKNRSNS